MHTKDPVIFVMIGLPGAGKSTAMEMLTSNTFVGTDWYIEKAAKEQGKSYNDVFKDEIKNAHKEMYKDVKFLIDLEKSFIWDQTNLTTFKRKKILSMIPDGYKKVAIYINTPVDVAIDRNLNRERNVPTNIIQQMYESMIAPSIHEGFDYILEFDQDGQLRATTEMKDGEVSHIQL